MKIDGYTIKSRLLYKFFYHFLLCLEVNKEEFMFFEPLSEMSIWITWIVIIIIIQVKTYKTSHVTIITAICKSDS